MKLVSKKVYDLSSSTRLELGIKLGEKCAPSVHFVIKNNRNIEVPLTLQSYGEIYAKRRRIREFLKFEQAQQEIALDKNTSLVFTETNNKRGLCLRSGYYHVSFLAKAAYLLLALQKSIFCAYMELSREADLVPLKIEKLMKITLSGVKNLGETLTREDLMYSEEIDENCLLENELLALYYDEILQKCIQKCNE